MQRELRVQVPLEDLQGSLTTRRLELETESVAGGSRRANVLIGCVENGVEGLATRESPRRNEVSPTRP
jgi:hypothetical protein